MWSSVSNRSAQINLAVSVVAALSHWCLLRKSFCRQLICSCCFGIEAVVAAGSAPAHSASECSSLEIKLSANRRHGVPLHRLSVEFVIMCRQRIRLKKINKTLEILMEMPRWWFSSFISYKNNCSIHQ